MRSEIVSAHSKTEGPERITSSGNDVKWDDAITGSPLAKASMTTIGWPSCADGRSKTVAFCNYLCFSSSVTHPRASIHSFEGVSTPDMVNLKLGWFVLRKIATFSAKA